MTTKALIVSELQKLVKRNNRHEHSYADYLLCQLLISDGHEDVVELYKKLPHRHG